MIERRSSAGQAPDNADGPGLVVGVAGLGDMGAGIASSIIRTFPMVAFDLRPAAVERFVAMGARPAESLAALADQCDVAVVVVVDDAQVKSVVGALFRHPGRLRSIIVSSTILPKTAIELSQQADELGLDLIDAPVSGGAEKASRGTITVLVGGKDDAVKRCWPVLESFGGNVFHIGPIGAGSVAKLANNLLSLGGNMLQLEAMQLADAYGVPEDALISFLTVSTGDSRNIHTWGRLDRVRRTHTLAGTPAIYDIFSKDVKAAAEAAGQQGVTLPITAGIGAMMAEKMKIRDKFLVERGMTGPIPRCSTCGQELAAPFREAGVHPECVYMKSEQSS